MPLTSEPYKNIKDFTQDVTVKNRSSFITTAYIRNEAYDRNVKMMKDMINLDRTFCLGADYRLPASYGRGRTVEEIEALEEKVGTTFFNTNYRSRWLGINDNCIVDVDKLEKLRTIVKAELKHDGKSSEYFMGVDVALSSKKSNNQTSIMIGKVKRDKRGKVQRVQITYTTNLPNGLNFTQQSLYIKKLKELFKVKVVVVDVNGLGIGLASELVKPTVDTTTGEEFIAFDTINDIEVESEEMETDVCLYGLKAQGIQSDIVVNFMNYVEMGKVQLLKRMDHHLIDSNGDLFSNETLPHLHTGLLIEEVGNISVKTLSNGRLGIEQNTKSIDKDRVSALMYLLYYIEKYENQVQKEKSDISGYLIFKQSRYK